MRSKLYYDLMEIIEKQDGIISKQKQIMFNLVNENCEKENIVNESIEKGGYSERVYGAILGRVPIHKCIRHLRILHK